MRIRASIMIPGGVAFVISAAFRVRSRRRRPRRSRRRTPTGKCPGRLGAAPICRASGPADDLQGVPVERPKEYGTRRFLTEQEMAERDARVGRLIESATTGERPKEGFWAGQKRSRCRGCSGQLGGVRKASLGAYLAGVRSARWTHSGAYRRGPEAPRAAAQLQQHAPAVL